MQQQAGARRVPHDRRGAYAVAALAIGAPAAALAALLAYDLDASALLRDLEPIANGLVGGLIAGSVAISLYLVKRRSASRRRKFALAQALVVELCYILEAMPDTSLGRFTASPTYHLERVGGGHGGHADMGRPAPRSGHARSMLGSVYRGLVSSGNISDFEPVLQMRLYGLFDQASRGDYDVVGGQVGPMMREVAMFRDANAPLALRTLLRRR